MTLKEISTMAKGRGINPSKQRKADLIRMIQREEGNFDCFGSATQKTCDQLDCMWRRDCLGPANV
jgi:hypothetical protein